MKLLINFISKLGVDSISKFIGFITLPVITRALGPEGYGQYSYFFVTLSYFGFFIDFGYLNYGTNKLCEKIDSKIVIGKIISLQLITLIFTYIVLIIAGYFIFDFDKYILILIFSLTFITQIFSIRYYYLANNKLYFSSISELAGQLIYAGLIFTIFLKFQTVLCLIILSVIQTCVTAIFLFIPYIRKNKIEINLNVASNFKTLKEAYKLGLATKAEGVTATFVILCIGMFLNEESVGLYNASYKVYLILLTVIQALSYTLMPLLLTGVKNSNAIKIKKISLIFYAYVFAGVILFLVTFFFSGKIILILFGNKFINAIPVLQGFSFTILIWPVVMFMALVILAHSRYNYLLLISICSMSLSIIISLIFINTFGIASTGFILALVALGTIIVSYYFIKKISSEENFNSKDLFSFGNFISELKIILKGKS